MKNLFSKSGIKGPGGGKALVFLGLVVISLLAIPGRALSGFDISISIPMPPPMMFQAPPQLVVLPDSYVYVMPDYDQDVYFYDGWWWLNWQGNWYRSDQYDRGWVYYREVPEFYIYVPIHWRRDYREHRWRGLPWNYRRLPHDDVQRNWSTWKKERHWERENTWGVKGLKPRQNRERMRRSEPERQNSAPRQEMMRPGSNGERPQRPMERQQERQPAQSRPNMSPGVAPNLRQTPLTPVRPPAPAERKEAVTGRPPQDRQPPQKVEEGDNQKKKQKPKNGKPDKWEEGDENGNENSNGNDNGNGNGRGNEKSRGNNNNR